MKVSVIVPVYNVKPYIEECLDSILGQTLQDIELICVDDGSDDGTLDVLRAYASRDARMTVMTQPHQRSAAARNKGIEAAKGDYLIFLDSDDFFDASLLETLVKRAEQTDADVVLCEGRFYDMKTKAYKKWDECLDVKRLSDGDVFPLKALGGRGYMFTTTGPINKLIRRKMVLDEGLRFQNTLYSNDLFFICMCMTLAKRISVCIGKPLVTYRVGMTTNTQAKSSKNPLEFTLSLTELMKSLKARGIYGAYEQPFVNLACKNIHTYLLKAIDEPQTFRAIFDWLHDGGFKAFGIHIRLIGVSYLPSYLATYEGVTWQTDAEDARKRILQNREKYGKAGLLGGHRVKRMLYVTKRLIGIEGLVPGIKHSLSLFKG